MADELEQLLACDVGEEYATAKSRHIFRDFNDATATIGIEASTITARFQKRAHNPFLLAAGFDSKQVRVPWHGNRTLRFVFG